jgi:hypothetical protein
MENNYLVSLLENQKFLWKQCKLKPELDVSCNLSIRINLKGELDVNFLEKSINTLIERHETLRVIGFSEDGGSQIISNSLKVSLYLHDYSSDALQLENEIIKQTNSPFVINGKQFYLFSLFKKTDLEFTLLFTIHHIIIDGMGVGILLTELAEIYSSFVDNRDCKLSTPTKFSNHLINRKIYLESEDCKYSDRYWQEVLADYKPMRIKRYKVKCYDEFSMGYVESSLSNKDFEIIKDAAYSQGVSPFIFLLSCFQVFTSSICDDPSSFIGFYCSNRYDGEENLVGYFSRQIPIKVYFSSNETFSTFLQRNKDTIYNMIENRRQTFTTLNEVQSNLNKGNSNSELAIIFNMDSPISPPFFFGLDVDIVNCYPRTGDLDLNLNLTLYGDRLKWELSYSNSKMANEFAMQYLNNLIDFTSRIAGNLNAPLHSVRTTNETVSSKYLKAMNYVQSDRIVICMHDPSAYHSLPDLIKNYSVYSLYAKEVDMVDSKNISVEDLGAFYAEALRSLKSKKLFICGYGEYGLIAYEAARILNKDGYSVEIILFDSWVPKKLLGSYNPVKSSDEMWTKYHPKVFNGKVHLFRAIGNEINPEVTNDHGWTTLCKDALIFYDFEESNKNLLLEPNIHEVADELSFIIADCFSSI